MKKSDSKNADNGNFILRKAEAFKQTGALGFIRGAARMSVRNWQSKDRHVPIHGTQPPRVSRAASCEQIFPIKITQDINKMCRAPSCEQITKCRINEAKPFLRMITESKFVGKSQNSDLYSGKDHAKGMLKFKKRDDATYSKNVHEKYIPLAPKYDQNTYTELKPKFPPDSRMSPLYQEIKKKTDKDKNSGRPATVRVTQSKKQTTDLAACFQELSKKSSIDSRQHEPLRSTKTAPENIKQNNHKVIIYFGDSIARNQAEANQKARDRIKEDLYAKKLLEETGNLGISKSSKNPELVSQVSVDNEPIYSEIVEQSVATDLEYIADGKSALDDNNNANVITTRTEDGVINVEFKDNFECARRWVDIISGSVEQDDRAPEVANESLDWSFVQGWRKR